MNAKERISVLEMQKKELVRRQTTQVLDQIIKHQPDLPVSVDFVKSAVDSNFQFYYGTVTRRIHFERNQLSPRMSIEISNEYLERAIEHIGYVASSDALFRIRTPENVVEVDFSEQQVRQEELAA